MSYKYKVYIGMNTYESNSRNAVKHLKNIGGDKCTVTDRSGKIISEAINSPEFGICHTYVPKDPPLYINN